MLIGERSRQFCRLGLGVFLATQLISAAVAEPAHSATASEAAVAADDSHDRHQSVKRGTLNAVGDRMTLTHSPAAGRTVQSSVSRISLPLLFELNDGQHASNVRAVARTDGYSLALTDDGMTLYVREPKSARVERAQKKLDAKTAAPEPARRESRRDRDRELTRLVRQERERIDALRLELMGAAESPSVVGEDRSPALAHYVYASEPARSRHNIAQHRRVRMVDVLPGIDKVVYGNQGRVEYDWIVRPGADPRRIVQRLKGAQSARIDPNGDLRVTTSNAHVTLKAPIAYQQSGASRTSVAARYVLRGDLLSFDLGAFDRSRELIIDPVVDFAAQLGDRFIHDIAASPDGRAHLLVPGCSSTTQLSVAPLPIGFFSFCPGSSLTRLNRAGTEAEFVTHFVDADLDAIAVDSSGRVVVAGTIQTDRILGQFGQQIDSKYSAIVVRLLSDGSAAEFVTRIDEVSGPASLAFGPDGDVYAAMRFEVVDNAGDPFRFSRRLPDFDDFLGDASSLTGLYAVRIRHLDGSIARRILVGTPIDSGGLFPGVAITIDSSSDLYLGWNVTSQANQFPSVNPVVVPEPAADPSSTRSTAWLPGRTDYLYGRGFLARISGTPPASLRYMTPVYGSRTADGVQDPQAGLQPQVITDIKVNAAGELVLIGDFVTKLGPMGEVIASSFIEFSDDGGGVFAGALDADGGIYVAGQVRPEVVPYGIHSVDEYWQYVASRASGVPGGSAFRGYVRKFAPDLSQEEFVVYITSPTTSQEDSSVSTIDVDPLGNTYAAGYAFALVQSPSLLNDPSLDIGPGAFLVKLAQAPRITSSPSPSALGQAVTVQFAAPSLAWTGSVAFSVDGTSLGTVPVVGGLASVAASGLAVGVHVLGAQYLGDAQRGPVSVAAEHIVKLRNDPTSVVLTTPNASPTEKQPISFAVQVSGRDLTGEVVLREDLVERGRATVQPDGRVSFTVPPRSPGRRVFTAFYLGDPLNAPSRSGLLTVTVQPVEPTVAIDSPIGGAVFGWPAAITLSAVVDLPPSAALRRLTFFANDVAIAEVTALPAVAVWNIAVEGRYVLSARVEAVDGRQARSAVVPIIVSAGGTIGPNDEIVFLHSDVAGSPVAATDWAARVRWRENYSPFGQRQSVDPAGAANRQWFHGKAEDPSGLQYLGARYYDPQIGRFLGVDPVEWKDENIHSFNRYAFANNNPVRFTDPDGREAAENCEFACRGWQKYGGKGAEHVQQQANEVGEAAQPLLKRIAIELTLIFAAPQVKALEGAAVLGMAIKAGAAKRGKNYVDGYRAVSKAEADDIAKHGFRPDPSGRSMLDKWFSETRQGAEQFRKTYPDLQEVVKTRVPRDVYDRSFKHPNIDNTGPGFCVQCTDLRLLPKP